MKYILLNIFAITLCYLLELKNIHANEGSIGDKVFFILEDLALYRDYASHVGY